MACVKCGFAASNVPEPMVECPACLHRSQSGSPGVWPPAPTSALPFGAASADVAAIKNQRQTGILMDVGAMASVYAASGLSHLMPGVAGMTLMVIVAIGSIYPHFCGSAHWAESKGYPRSTGRIIGWVSWLGPVILALMPDKNKSLA